ncbi:Transient receptor potential cation channel subfamily M member 6 [Paramuricea clavata]|uniref:Transient receptor potential cation channel subfamily M member 6 n=1 Tax=Paramuricea clavata TaxID=317549 RepID=A0A7D9DIS7_PARCT|nr:Transient receptor potential cation channel subfamily M member 6 [Paramuricea clavata]
MSGAFQLQFSNKKMMLLDIQGSMFNLYDPEIATAELNDEGEFYFCAGNLSCLSISKFNSEHKCNQFCAMLNLASETELTL